MASGPPARTPPSVRQAGPAPDSERGAVVFDLAGAFEGARVVLPLAAGVLPFGLVFGVLARQAGLSVAETALMSGTVFAAAAQFAALGMWGPNVPVIAVVVTTLIVNLRHLLMGATLHRWYGRVPAPLRYFTFFFIVDETWAMTLARFQEGKRNAAFLLGSSATVYVSWVLSTVGGRTLGSALRDPSRWGLDFAFTAVFLFLLISMWKGRATSLLPWLAAAVVSVVSAKLLPGKWYILCGAFAGSAVGAARDA